MGELAVIWQELQNLFVDFELGGEDKCVWVLNGSGKFSVNSIYLALETVQVKCPYRKLWFIIEYL